jgi:DNA-directed RNA polymerase subunit M/transcription elongation factor TFIIS
MPKAQKSRKKPPAKQQEPFLAKLHKALNKACPTLVYPTLRVLCITALASAGTETAVHQMCNGHLRQYIPAIQYAIAHKGTPTNDLLNAYITETNAAANAVNKTDEVLGEIRGMHFRTSVQGCHENARRCPKCHSTDLLPYTRQLCGGDEMATLFFNCNTAKCSHSNTPFK